MSFRFPGLVCIRLSFTVGQVPNGAGTCRGSNKYIMYHHFRQFLCFFLRKLRTVFVAQLHKVFVYTLPDTSGYVYRVQVGRLMKHVHVKYHILLRVFQVILSCIRIGVNSNFAGCLGVITMDLMAYNSGFAQSDTLVFLKICTEIVF